jgi:hypothetical protein
MSVAARARYEQLFTQDHADRVLAEWLERIAGARFDQQEAEVGVTP